MQDPKDPKSFWGHSNTWSFSGKNTRECVKLVGKTSQSSIQDRVSQHSICRVAGMRVGLRLAECLYSTVCVMLAGGERAHKDQWHRPPHSSACTVCAAKQSYHTAHGKHNSLTAVEKRWHKGATLTHVIPKVVSAPTLKIHFCYRGWSSYERTHTRGKTNKQSNKKTDAMVRRGVWCEDLIVIVGCPLLPLTPQEKKGWGKR